MMQYALNVHNGSNRVILTVRRSLPVCPDKQTISEPAGTSQSATSRPSRPW